MKDLRNLNDYAAEAHRAQEKWWLDPYAVITPGGCIGTFTGTVSSTGRLWVEFPDGHSAAFHPEEIQPGSFKLNRNKGELLMLIVSEIAEAMEGVRKDAMDDKLPHRKMEEVELTDALIRIFDYVGAHGLDIEGAYREKMTYNASREDHTREARRAVGGKRF